MTIALHRRLAWCWLLVVLALAGHQAWLWLGQRAVLDSDVLAMLPADQRQPVVADATRVLADAGERRVVVLIGGGDAASARRAGDHFAARLAAAEEQAGTAGAVVRWQVGSDEQSRWLQFYAPRAGGLLTDDQRRRLQEASAGSLAGQALASLQQPVGLPRVGLWQQDPLGLLGGWLSERAAVSRVRVVDERLMLQEGAATYALLIVESPGSAFAVARQRALVASLQQARQAVLSEAPQVRVLMGGVPLFAAAAAAQAEREIHTIGLGSLAGVVLLTWCAFRSLRPRLLVTLSMAVGLAAAVSATVIVFGSLHLVTLVFGVTLLGVAENYGSNYFCARMGLPHEARWQMLRRQWPVVGLAMLTTVVAYALIGVPPFPGLRQMALFSAVGLLGAFITVMLWFPWLDGREARPTRFAHGLGGLRRHWPALRGRAAWAWAALAGLVLAAGLYRLQGNDDIRQLQSAPAALVQDQREIGRLLDFPGVAQFVLVRGDSAEQVLQREEALLAVLAARGVQVQAVSQWLPSLARQREDAALRTRREAEVLAALSVQLDEPLAPVQRQAAPLMPQAWLASPVSEPLRHQWLGRAADGQWTTAVLLRGGEGRPDAGGLRAATQALPGVLLVDKVGEISALMGRYRFLVGAMVVAGHLLVGLVLMGRFGRQAWRALLPTSLASALTLAIFGLAGIPLQLFHLLPLLILLGLGVDYGIFMLEQPGREEIQPFLSVSLAALSTLLSFGLLAVSGTPALHTFGLTMLTGVTLSWWLTPLFLPTSPEP